MLKDIGKLARSLPLIAGLFSSLNWAVDTVCLCSGNTKPIELREKIGSFFLFAILPEMPKFIWASRARKPGLTRRVKPDPEHALRELQNFLAFLHFNGN